MKLSKLFSVLFLSLILSSSVFAQKSWALLFSWDRFNAAGYPVSSFYTYNGEDFNINETGGIGVEYRLNPSWSIQGGLAIGIGGDEQTQGTTKTTRDMSLFALSAGASYYFLGYDTKGVRPYLGGRLSYGTQSYTSESTNAPNSQKFEDSYSSVGFGVFGGADVELLEGLRVGASYGLVYNSYPESESTSTITSGGVTTETTVNGPSASMFSTVVSLNVKFLF